MKSRKVIKVTDMKDEKSKISADAEEILKKYDKGADFRVLSGMQNKLLILILFSFSVFQLYTAIFGSLDAVIQRAAHLAFGLSLVYLLYPSRKSFSKTKLHPLDVVLAILAAGVCIYVLVNYKELVMRSGRVNTADMIVGVIAILLVLESARRVVGWPMVIIAVIFISYALFGRYLPGMLSHRGIAPDDLVQQLFFTTEGIFGIPIGVSSTFIFMFLLFGAFLEKTGMGEFFIDISKKQ